MKFSTRADKIEPFYVMEVAKAAQQLAKEVANGPEPMIFLNIGEPDFTAPAQVQQAASACIAQGSTQYTNALGLEALREAISAWYQSRFGVDVPAQRIVITAGASAALQLACLALIEPGDEILMPDPSYPCNRHFVSAAEGTAKLIPTGAAERYQLSAEQVAAHWGEQTRGVLLASPSNPTGTSIDPAELRRIHEVVKARGGITIVDEIYLGLSYEEAFGHSALAISDDIISINSFSKYFNMTGWRLGWMVVPEAMVPVVERMAQNLFICASTISQHAALACFTPESIATFEARRAEFKARRDYFLPALKELGFGIDVMPDGAFYAWADCTPLCEKLGVKDSWEFAYALMEKAHLAITPGRDFGTADTARYVRFSTANSMEQLQEAVRRMQQLFK
ncbi:pyridoxal phosphate-dependent aminotransferase [Comamonas kerstersii]|jgi:aspartate/methionine/tyrosine aminotransferase|uniref:Aminotransferase n=1 Tax=Comamonas kerstersii TaxID=225992 RepID=A0A0W7Z113_9BURK|nr:pyridoxal phosphate-dependent aminotransferase [Comamonas kerstersii]KAB0587960.1 pyridoxal phosphate-dependent aminotransferase [Comamonas kerstersii]KUF41049.1 aminotransferase [Comamonas kerstersii]OOH85992.1 aminotransferase [Comamonas kerstersii]OOH92761.1 aminotransferase [Comamonas kerstersii]